MGKQDQRKTQATGHEVHGVHLCHKCGWPFPNSHPSPKHRRAHKRICGTIDGYNLVKTDDDTGNVHLSNDEHHSDEDRKKRPSPRGSETSNSQKPGGEVGERLISGDEVFADAVAEFSDGGWNSGAEENLREMLEPLTVEDDSAHISKIDGFGGGAVAAENQLKKNSSDSNLMQDPETPVTSFLAIVPDCRTEEPGMQFLDNKPSLPSDIYLNKVEGPIDGMREGVSIDAGNSVTEPAFSLHVDATDNFDRNIPSPSREAPIRIIEDRSKLDVNDVAFSDTEGARDFVPLEENSAEGLELHQSANSLGVELLQHTSIPANNSQVDLGFSTLQEGEEKDEHGCETFVPDDISNPTIVTEDSEDPKGVKLQISSILQSHETITNDEDDLKDVTSVERFIVLQSELSRMASEVPPGESYVADDNTTQENESYKLMVVEESRKQQIVEPLVEGKTNVDQSSDDNGASLADLGPNMNGQTDAFSKEHDFDDFCKYLEVNSSDCPVLTSSFIPADFSVCSVDNDKNTIGDDRDCVTEESDHAVRISTLQSANKEHLLQELPVNIVDGEDNSSHEKLETKSHDTVKFNFREGIMVSKDNQYETFQPAGLIFNDGTHHVEEIKIDGVHIDGSEKLEEADTEKNDDETKTATLQPSGSLSQLQEKPLINNAEGYGLGVCEVGEIENVNRAEDQSLAGSLENTLPFESAFGDETGDESAKKSQSILCKQSLTVSGSEQETNKEDTDIIGIVSAECAIHADSAFDLQTVSVIQDKEMDDPVSKDNQTEGFRGNAGGLLSASIQDQGGNDLVKQQHFVSGIDGSVGICSRSDSLDCNWGSVSVLSLQSDAPATLDAETLPLVVSDTSTEGNSNFKSDVAYDFQQSEKSEMSEPPSFMTLIEPGNEGQMNAAPCEGQTGQNPQHPTSTSPLGWFPSLPQVANDSEGRKKNEEIIAKVTNWSTGKHHAQLKTLLSEVAQDTKAKSPSTKENFGLENQKNEKAAEDNGAKTTTRTVNSILGPESPATHVAKKEIAKEWNSPARYPSDIQREKRKVRGRPFWTQFVCCTSVNSQ